MRETGLQVPDDISLVGFDDIELTTYCHPPLTTVRQPTYKLGRRAMKIVEVAILLQAKPIKSLDA